MSTTAQMNDKSYEMQNGLPNFVVKLTIIFGVLLALSVLIYVGGTAFGKRLSSTGYTTNTNAIEIIVGNDIFSVPANLIRHPDQRASKQLTRLDLQVHWPTKSGYSDELAPAFRQADASKIELVMLSIVQRRNLLDMSERFDPVYKSAIDTAKIKTLKSGLKVAPLQSDFGYINERLVYSDDYLSGTRRFVARCQASAKNEERLLLPCETDIFIGNSTAMRARFPLAQLARWQAFSTELDRVSKALLAKN